MCVNFQDSHTRMWERTVKSLVTGVHVSAPVSFVQVFSRIFLMSIWWWVADWVVCTVRFVLVDFFLHLALFAFSLISGFVLDLLKFNYILLLIFILILIVIILIIIYNFWKKIIFIFKYFISFNFYIQFYPHFLIVF
jgi:hypothetical protein